MTVLQEAEKIINGARRKAYGPVEKSFQDVAAMWSVILGKPVSMQQVAMCMVALKMCRQLNSAKRDNIVDMAGYVGLMEKL